MANEAKQSFLLYKNYYEILDDLQDVEMGTLFRAILKYQAKGELPELPLNLKIVFNFIKNQFDMDEKKYNEFLEKQSENGKKGGRPKTDNQTQENPKKPTLFSETEKKPTLFFENPKNPPVFSETQKSLNENENVNVNENENENLSLSLSLLSEREGVIGGERGINIQEDFSDERGETLSNEDRVILENYVRRKKLATKNVRAYVNKIISNGDHKAILEEEKERENRKKQVNKISPQERIKAELASIHDKRSAAKVLSVYHNALEEYPPELEEVAEKYNLSKSYELEKYCYDLYLEKIKQQK